MKEKAVVTGKEGNDILIRTVPGEQCSGCCSCSASKPRSFKVPAPDAGVFQEGDEVEIDVDPVSMMRTYIIVYAIPLAVFVIFIVGGYALTASPVLSFFAASAALSAVYLFTALCIRKKPSILPAARLSKTKG